MRIMSRFITSVLLVCSVILTAGCSSSDHQSKITYLAIIKAEKAFMAAFREGDSVKLSQLYANDGQLLPANNDTIIGHKAIASFWHGLMALGIHSVNLKTIEVEGNDQRAHEVGHYTIHDEAGQIIDYGKYIVIWKNNGTSWQLYRHIWTTSMAKAGGVPT